MYHIYFGILGERSLRWEFLEENYVQVTVLISLFTLLSVLVKLLFFGSLPISSHLLNNNLLSVCKHYTEE